MKKTVLRILSIFFFIAPVHVAFSMMNTPTTQLRFKYIPPAHTLLAHTPLAHTLRDTKYRECAQQAIDDMHREEVTTKLSNFRSKQPQLFGTLFYNKDVPGILSSYLELVKSSRELCWSQPTVYHSWLDKFNAALGDLASKGHVFPQKISIHFAPFKEKNPTQDFDMFFNALPLSLATGECVFCINPKVVDSIEESGVFGFFAKHELGHALQFFTHPLVVMTQITERVIEAGKFAEALLSGNRNFDYPTSREKILALEGFADKIAADAANARERTDMKRLCMRGLINDLMRYNAWELFSTLSSESDRERWWGILDALDYQEQAKKNIAPPVQNSTYIIYFLIRQKEREEQKRGNLSSLPGDSFSNLLNGNDARCQ